MPLTEKVDRALWFLERYFVGIGVLATTLMVFIGVVTRYFFNFSFSWMEEASQYYMLWVASVGAA